MFISLNDAEFFFSSTNVCLNLRLGELFITISFLSRLDIYFCKDETEAFFEFEFIYKRGLEAFLAVSCFDLRVDTRSEVFPLICSCLLYRLFG